ncbi:MAG TPA: acetoin utilization protein AcuC [Actinomycetales bacterium]|nr:acetoin utilization protein AcuC [Actinomycetales bacterium]
MTSLVQFAWSEDLTRYNFGPRHPMSPLRLELTVRLARELGLLDSNDLEVVWPEKATTKQLQLVHTPEYVAAVQEAAASGETNLEFGLGTDDVPVFRDIHTASARIVGGSLALAENIWRGEVLHGVNIAGGLHHAMPDGAGGFCVYNDASVAIARLLELGAKRVAYVDLDAHHGDGVERAFWDDPRVLTISVHESPLSLFPGTGHPVDLGGADAEGSAVNVALPGGIRDGKWLRAVHAVIDPVLRTFEPEIIVSQHGVDGHWEDPLTHLALSVDGMREAMNAVHNLSHELCEGRWLALGGGGYEIVDVVPRAWSHLLAIALHTPLALRDPIPQGWRDYVAHRLGRHAKAALGDDADVWWKSWEVGYDPADEVDRAVMATRKAVFPLHGLDPYFD